MLNILIVEDDITIRELLNYNLKNTYKIFEASSAEDALELCDDHSIHLILLDWMLPEMSGLSFLRTIKKQKENLNIPVIFVTAKEEEADKVYYYVYLKDVAAKKVIYWTYKKLYDDEANVITGDYELTMYTSKL